MYVFGLLFLAYSHTRIKYHFRYAHCLECVLHFYLSCRLELWPGFITSILQYERSVMLGLDISHKILRMDTVYDFLNDLYNEDRSRFREMATKKLVGEIVLTR